MSTYRTEEEQVELLKQWWKEYGLSLIIGIFLAIIIVLGWQYYRHYQEQQAEQASVIYTNMMNGVLNQQDTMAAQQANLLLMQYKGTVYASVAALVLAKQAAEANQYPIAVKQLNWVIDHSSSANLKDIATLRLARVYLAQKQPQQALRLLQADNNNGYLALVAEIEGDAYLQIGDIAKAQSAYQLAIQKLPAADVNRPILAMKLADLAG